MKRKLPIRKNIRLENYDYSDGGGYFITVCAKDRKCLFGNVNKNCVKSIVMKKTWFCFPM